MNVHPPRLLQGELREKLRIVRTVLEQNAFNGINRKAQLKPTKWKPAAPMPAPAPSAFHSSSAALLAAGAGPSALEPNSLLVDTFELPTGEKSGVYKSAIIRDAVKV